jgi:hypothetical protein
MAKLKEFAYYVQGGKLKGNQLYILATSQKQVVEMLSDYIYITTSDIKNYFSLWGSTGQEIMKDVDKTEPIVYAIEMSNCGFGKPIGELRRLV